MKYDNVKLRNARLEKLITQTELAKITGLSPATITTVEQGRGPWIKAIRKMQAALGVKDVVKTDKRRTA